MTAAARGGGHSSRPSREADHRHLNAAAPGFVTTDINRHTGHLTAAEGAAVVVRLATLAADGPTGGFFGAEGPVPW
ncbi:hypothetical protein [Phytohabitans houttuyneae]|uniref:Uncharacterized protein n=1 Tax=Phytohabitans houttuyneae TaxID=1076126 RepID=A0A6V8KGU4_9ACTN|nr:hypothetical protein [Phytohabitans houttuyneae]GFJ83054.1 hypothetical protein Phou_072340 [Phytohabitans houttuyneae]